MRQLSFEVCPEAAPLSSAAPVRSVSKGSMTEVIVSEGSALQPFQLLPVLALCSDQQRWLMWLSPSQNLNKEWLAKAGMSDSPVLHLNTQPSTQVNLCIKALSSGKSHLIIEWSGELAPDTRQLFRRVAEENGSHLFVVRGE